MNRVFLAVGLIAAVAAGCGETDSMGGNGGNGGNGGVGGGGGMGGTIGPLTWTTPGLTIVGDTCVGDAGGFFVDEPAEYEITIEGTSVTVVQVFENPDTSFVLTTDEYTPEQDVVTVTGQVNNDDFPPCVAELSDAFRMELDDPDVSLDLNDTVQVTWTHSEDDVSDTVGDCEGEWFNPLPCSGEATFTLTQQPSE